jgi:hypothetical protein
MPYSSGCLPTGEWTVHARLGHVAGEPAAHVFFQAQAVHVVVERLLQRHAQRVVVHARGVDEADVVLGEAHGRQRQQRHAVVGGLPAYRRMHGAGEAVEEAGLDAAGGE